MGFFDSLKKIASFPEKLKDKAKHSLSRFRAMINVLRGINVNPNDMMRDKDRLLTRITAMQLGKMCVYYYDPKWKKKLPYYDTFPMIIPLEIYSDGFLGLNLHYLPPGHRAILLDELYRTIYGGNKTISDKQRIQITYALLKSVSKTRLYIPCIKRYLNEHIRSKFYMVPIDEWDTAVFLPNEQFVKQSKQYVWKESLKKVRGS